MRTEASVAEVVGSGFNLDQNPRDVDLKKKTEGKTKRSWERDGKVR